MLLIVNLQLSEFLLIGNMAIRRMESQPKLATSYTPDNLNKQKLRIWQPVRSSGKVGLLRIYLFILVWLMPGVCFYLLICLA